MKAQESLYTDRYELSMLDGALVSGVINAKATFEVFTRSLANGYRYGVVGGTGRLLQALDSFSFDDDTISWLLSERIVSTELASFLSTYRFEGDVHGYPEGEVFTSLSPVLRVEGRFCDLARSANPRDYSRLARGHYSPFLAATGRAAGCGV